VVEPSLVYQSAVRIEWTLLGSVSHPGSGKLNRSLHTCAQDVQITRTANNMVNRYNISLNYKLESFTKGPVGPKEILQSGAEI
jgi:hypothetical protein